jgi:predicted  nucleic acid-binding Zn-ribbon protein
MTISPINVTESQEQQQSYDAAGKPELKRDLSVNTLKKSEQQLREEIEALKRETQELAEKDEELKHDIEKIHEKFTTTEGEKEEQSILTPSTCIN